MAVCTKDQFTRTDIIPLWYGNKMCIRDSSCSLRLGELLGLTWDCVDISPEAIEENRAYAVSYTHLMEKWHQIGSELMGKKKYFYLKVRGLVIRMLGKRQSSKMCIRDSSYTVYIEKNPTAYGRNKIVINTTE